MPLLELALEVRDIGTDDEPEDDEPIEFGLVSEARQTGVPVIMPEFGLP